MSFGQGGPSWDGSRTPGHNRTPGHDPYTGPRDLFGNPLPDRPESETPDWAALADASAKRARRKRWLLIGGGVVATGAIVAAVATAVVANTGGGNDNPVASSGGGVSSPPAGSQPTAGPAPSFSPVAPKPPVTPESVLASADKDTAPLSAATLFPGAKLTAGPRTYLKGPTARTTDCAAAAQGKLGAVLKANGCDEVIRATYHQGGVAVTIGVAVFPKEAQATKAKAEAKDGIASLLGPGVKKFCRAPSVCRQTTNSYGRYAYFTVGGFLNGKNVKKTSKDVYTTGDDVAEFAFRQILHRGRLAAAAAASAPAP